MGHVDFQAAGGPTTPKAYEIEASPRGVCWPQLPHDDEEGWKRLWAVFPLAKGLHVVPGAGAKEGERLETFTYHYPLFVTYEGRLSDEEAYGLVKAIDEGWEEHIKDALPKSHIYIFKDAIHAPYSDPVHPGVIRYAKDKGIWTDEDEAANNALLEKMAEVQEAWDTVMAEALEEGITGKDFPAYWLERRAELLGW